MLRSIQLLAICIMISICSCEDEPLLEDLETGSSKMDQTSQKQTLQPTNELIILYPEGLTEDEKVQKRNEYGVTDYKQCPCADENLELWIFDPSNSGHINIEEKKETAKVDEEIEGVDFNPIIQIKDGDYTIANDPEEASEAISRIVAANNGVTIAVLDTGIHYNYEGFPQNFLYNSREDECKGEDNSDRFGWNFVANNNNPFDDHPSMHGTVVSTIITSNLEARDVDFQLLPVKVADQNGNIHYFDALCGFQYAVKKEHVRVVNLSFGWYHEAYDLLHRFIDEVQEEILVVCSAGNASSDNDTILHYPSSYASENILAIAGIADINSIDGVLQPDVGLSYFSNYGLNTVDIAALSENILFTINGDQFLYDGTSFSAAYVSFFSAYLYENGMNAESLRNTVLANSMYSTNLSSIKYSAFIYE